MVLLCPPFHSLLFIPNVLNHDIRQASWHRAPKPLQSVGFGYLIKCKHEQSVEAKKKKKKRKKKKKTTWKQILLTWANKTEWTPWICWFWVSYTEHIQKPGVISFVPKREERRGEERRGEERRGEERRDSQPTLYNTSFSAQHRFFLYNNQKVPRGQSSCCNAPAKTASIKPASKRCKRWLMQVCLSEIIWNSLLKGETPFTCRKQTGFYSDVAINRQKKSHNL